MIANAEASYYVADHVIVIEDCSRAMFGYDYNLKEAPQREAEYRELWLGFERILAEVLPEPVYLVTTREGPVADPNDWHEFLLNLGYRPFNEEVMVKKP